MALIAAGATCAPASPVLAGAGCPSAGACVAVHLLGRPVVVLDPADIAADADVSHVTYTTRSGNPPQDHSDPVVQQGLSIGKLITEAGADPSTVTLTRTQRRDGTWSTLSADDLALDPPPVVYVIGPTGGSSIGYVRPQRDGQDVNGEDVFQTDVGGRLDLYVYTGPLLTVTARAASSRVAQNAPLRFTGSVQGAGAGSLPLTYTWTFGDGTTKVVQTSATNVQATHTYATQETVEAVLTVTGPDRSGGASDPLTITVGRPKKTTGGHQKGGTGGSHDKNAPSTGPSSGQGTRQGAAASAKTSTGTARDQTSRPSHAGAQPTLTPSPDQAGGAGLTAVNGVLIGATNAVPLAAIEEQPRTALAATAPAARQAPRRALPWAFAWTSAWIGAALLLLGAGAAREISSIRWRGRR